jgi:hypothetical protein
MLQYQSGFGNEFATEAHPGACRRARMPRNMLRSASTPNRSAARRSPRRAPEPPHMELPHPALGDARAVSRVFAHSTHMRSGPFNEVPTPPNQMRWNPLPIPKRIRRTSWKECHARRQRRPGDAGWGGHPSLRGQRLNARPLLLQRRWRDADSAAAGPAAAAHRTRHFGGCAGRTGGDSARHQVPR